MSPTRGQKTQLIKVEDGTIGGRFGMNQEVRDIFEIQAEITRTTAEVEGYAEGRGPLT